MNIKYIVIDVDGTLTDSGVYYDNLGNELKKFNTKDGAGIQVAKAAGLKIIVLTGRECNATLRRMSELQADTIEQNIKNKGEWLARFMAEHSISKAEIGSIGDDVNDLPSMRLCGFIGCPADACKEVKSIADYISPVSGGHGAVRDCIEHLLTESGQWTELIEKVYNSAGV
ncbi:MAG: HAD hydrolase family protein [Treponema sp.]|jgi:3-deoxy-D-manno-octulosonate 8-phosphate phosphatase (KDO 8-P phosphatase)|nr:HAD hydrolase family protein [Treponema sp.]